MFPGIIVLFLEVFLHFHDDLWEKLYQILEPLRLNGGHGAVVGAADSRCPSASVYESHFAEVLSLNEELDLVLLVILVRNPNVTVASGDEVEQTSTLSLFQNVFFRRRSHGANVVDQKLYDLLVFEYRTLNDRTCKYMLCYLILQTRRDLLLEL